MAQWEGSTRRERLPANWAVIRKRILRRDSDRCTHRHEGLRCDEPATEVDHIRPGDDHSDTNLRSLCEWHHQKKSSSEGGAARAAVYRRNNNKFRRSEPHPGLL